MLTEILFYLRYEEFGQLARRLKCSPEAISETVLITLCFLKSSDTSFSSIVCVCVFSHKAASPPPAQSLLSN